MAGSTNMGVLNDIYAHALDNYNSVNHLGHIYNLPKNINALSRVVGKYGGSEVSISEFQNSMYFKCEQAEYHDHKRQAWIYRATDNLSFDWTESQKKGSAEWNCFQMNKATVDSLKSKGFVGIQDMGVDGLAAGERRTFDSANWKPDTDWQWYNFCMRWGTYYIRFYK